MRTKIMLVTVLSLLAGYAVAQEGGKNLKVLQKTWTKSEIKKYMKGVADGLGVQCDFCHNTDDMSADTPKKERAREMMTMVMDVNKKLFKGEDRVKCVTCHNGSQKPKN